eukprot:scaffold25164_cov96-Isochrysis_galbana.AAC.1
MRALCAVNAGVNTRPVCCECAPPSAVKCAPQFLWLRAYVRVRVCARVLVPRAAMHTSAVIASGEKSIPCCSQ